ncbi:hypothetical protein BM536_001555 [Streptomyces phaeoluteigriseus]|uniref:Uncharacterized protein n=1 Tax=Streptomyces phaeoluteigriseus TaxID=114686 RepID=A0A1V6MZG7_9ACTN|nr:hypothetical protein [Streptomyces phaeoluteigriseus]OQD57774.1 hypothetical protein BM536_001555 [Streptomyces phaeoluteigriseus]
MATVAAARDHVRPRGGRRLPAGGGPADRWRDVVDLPLAAAVPVARAVRHGGGLAGFETEPARARGVRPEVHAHGDVVPDAAYGLSHPPLAAAATADPSRWSSGRPATSASAHAARAGG